VTDSRARREGLHRQAGDGWVECACGRRHWGLHGAAGLLLFRERSDGGHDVVLQHRALWSDEGGTWGLPGGALAPGEAAVTGALREASEEAGIDPDATQVLATWVLDHGTWAYTTVIARATGDQDPRATDPESVEVLWVPAAEVDGRPLLTAFAHAWPALRTVMENGSE
jgi:8-oxo-dGTP pyrophosphatase MutT (NUDIX family)